jgi:hypothetical protein
MELTYGTCGGAMKSFFITLFLVFLATFARAENYKTSSGKSGSFSMVQLMELNSLANQIVHYDLEGTDLDLAAKEHDFSVRFSAAMKTGVGQSAMIELVKAAVNFTRTGGVMNLSAQDQESTPVGLGAFEPLQGLNPIVFVALRGASLITMNSIIRHFTIAGASGDARKTKKYLALCVTIFLCPFGARIHGMATSSHSWECGNCNPAILTRAMKCANQHLDPLYNSTAICGYFESDEMVQDVKAILAAAKILDVLNEVAEERKNPKLSGLSIDPETGALIDSKGAEKALNEVNDAIGTSYIWQITQKINVVANGIILNSAGREGMQ